MNEHTSMKREQLTISRDFELQVFRKQTKNDDHAYQLLLPTFFMI